MERRRIDRALPGVATARTYERSWLRPDLVAGATLSALMIPAGMAYAEVAGLPPVTGLYASIVPLLAYALFGPSRVLVLGPDSSLAPMIAAAVLPLSLGDPAQSVALAGLLAILVGLILLTGRVFGLGFVTGLLSKPIRVGYLNGIALVVIASQLPKLLGVSVPGGSVWVHLGQTAQALAAGEANGLALAIGLASLAAIVVTRIAHTKVPGVLVAVVGSMVVTAVLGLDTQIPVVGALPQGLPAPALTGLDLDDVVHLLGPAAGIAVIAFADTGVLSRTLSMRHHYQVDGSQEMGALGIANAASGLFGGFPVSGSTSRTPVAVQAGARTQLVGVVAAGLLIVFMVVVPGLPRFLPTSTLAAVVIVAAASMVDVRTLVRLARISRTETALLVAAFLGVAFVGVLEGILVAVGLSLMVFVRQAWNPYRTELVNLEGVPGYHDVSRHADGERIPGLVIVRFDAPLFFANGGVFESHIRDLVARAPQPVRWVIVAAEPITGLDTTALDDLVELDELLERREISMVFAEMKGPIKDRLVKFGVGARFGPEHFFPTVNNAVKAYRAAFDP
ncbi:SulP family inorganic anion transporter [Pengzhenrongella frigida]|uniref:SulP family inorganic anion transporter n=1 Tax=Pengzhenrongella frigida TaxID=1259133 RepID=A0A4Q5MWY3_9MICO|nr:SulP family inorganic anion transporter [Cellulomonas sp. HLT2-17]RYV50095.1 SulP family inorganic anion transporter [Cellulomonas sp. HLT2-17]